jgi:nicotinamidase-related amidase
MSNENNSIPNTNYRNRFGHLDFKSPELLNPMNHTLIFIDHEGQMTFPIESTPRLELRNNLASLGYFSRMYEIPVILSTIGEERFAGPIMKELRQFYPDAPVYDRSSVNFWEDDAAREAVIATGNKKLVFAGLWTDVCLAYPVISALKAGYEVYFITDASGAMTKESHDVAIQRMIQAGAIPLGTISYTYEVIRDYGREDNRTADIADLRHEWMIKYTGIGSGVDYADYMVQNYATYTGFGK